MLLGTDAGGPPFIATGSSALDELRLLVTAGLRPYDALRAATIDAAKFLHRESEIGTIEPGKIADLLLLRGDPLRDIENVELRAGVMLRGKWLPSDRADREVVDDRDAEHLPCLDEFPREHAEGAASASWCSDHGSAVRVSRRHVELKDAGGFGGLVEHHPDGLSHRLSAPERPLDRRVDSRDRSSG